MAKVTLQSIADQVGVSRMTVSNAFSRPDQLSPDLRERILGVAADLGYIGPHPAARSLATGTTGTIGVLWGDRLRTALADEATAGFLGAVADELAPMALTLLPSAGDDAVVPARDVAMDGAIVYSCPPESTSLEWLHRRSLPVVHVDMPAVPGVACVTIDDRGGARLAAEHLRGLGHRRVMAFTSPSALPGGEYHRVVVERLAGWRDGLGAIEPTIGVSHTAFDHGSVRDLLVQHRPTAVLCLTDVMAQVVLVAAAELGLRVPDDLSVVGFDDHPLASRVGLTTVRQDVDAKGRLAAQALRQALAHHRDATLPAPVDQCLDVALIVRGSSGPVPLG